MTERDRCPSQFQLDRLSAGEVSDIERHGLGRHLASCPACGHAITDRAVERAQFTPDPQLLARLRDDAPRAAPHRRRRLAAAAVPAVVCAAAIALVVRSRPSSPEPRLERLTTTKGGIEARLVVERAGALIPVAHDGGEVHPGDRLQLALSLPEPRFVAMYSLDGAGAVSRYAPVDAPMIALPAAAEQLLPNSTILDGVLGRETLAVYACARVQTAQTLRDHVRDGAPAGCDVIRIEVRKVAP
jgi:hypothetical protein